MSEDKKKTKLFGESMEMLGENLVESNAKLGDEAKNDELGQAAAEPSSPRPSRIMPT